MKAKTIICTIFIVGIILVLISSTTTKSTDDWTWKVKSGMFISSEYLHNTEIHHATIHNNSSGKVTCNAAEPKQWAKTVQIQSFGDQLATVGSGDC